MPAHSETHDSILMQDSDLGSIHLQKAILVHIHEALLTRTEIAS